MRRPTIAHREIWRIPSHLESAARRGIPVVHAPDYGTQTVADQAFALMIAAARKISQVDRDLKMEGWLWPAEKYCGVDLAGKTIGIVGLGRIGKAMARRAAGFDMRRLVYDPYVDSGQLGWDDLEFGSLDQLLEVSDFLSLHCVLTDETSGMIGADELAKMKSTAILINVSRGGLIDEAALIAAIEGGPDCRCRARCICPRAACQGTSAPGIGPGRLLTPFCVLFARSACATRAGLFRQDPCAGPW